MIQTFKFNKNHCKVHFSHHAAEDWEDAILYYGFCSDCPIRVKFDKERGGLALSDFMEIPKCGEDELDHNDTKTLKFIKLSKENLHMLSYIGKTFLNQP